MPRKGAPQDAANSWRKSPTQEGRAQGGARVCRQPMDGLSTNPGANSRSRRAGARRPRRLGCRFFGLLFFGQAKKSDSLTAVSETRDVVAGRLRKHKPNKAKQKQRQMDPGLRRDDEV